MPIVHIPSLLQKLTHGKGQVTVEGRNLRQVIRSLDEKFPGMKAQLCDRDDRIRPNLSVFVNGNIVPRSLIVEVGENDRVNFLPAISGGLEREREDS